MRLLSPYAGAVADAYLLTRSQTSVLRPTFGVF